MNTYKDDLEAALARAEAAERRARIAEEEAAAMERHIEPARPLKPRREPGARGRWWKQNWMDVAVGGFLCAFLGFVVVALTNIAANASLRTKYENDVRACIVRRHVLDIGNLRGGDWEIDAVRPYLGEKRVEQAPFTDPRAAAERAFAIGCPMVAVEK